MPAGYFRAVAVDYDGTLTATRRPDPESLAAIAATRDAGYIVVLVTGRILAELRMDFPEVDEHFDAIVAENGAVLAREGVERPLTEPVQPKFIVALRAAGVPLRAGQVIVATEVEHDRAILELIGRFGLEHQLVRNRGALMVIPAGVSKGSGVTLALAELGISCHNAVAVGDAENDHTLLEACELGVAVANAVPSLRAQADLVLRRAAGLGVQDLLREHLPSGLPGVPSRRRRMLLGHTPEGHDVSIPSSRLNIEIYGESGRGKSYVAGLIAEMLATMGYVLCVLDLEGDHAGLGDLPGVVVLGGSGPLPTSDELREFLRHGPVSVVIDLSLQSIDTKHDYGLRVIEQCQMMQDVTGLPHWIVIEEAHIPLAAHWDGSTVRVRPRTGLCLVSFHPDQLSHHGDFRRDARIVVRSEGVAELWYGKRGPVTFAPCPRRVAHCRHTRKYLAGRVPHERRFHFRTERGETGRIAANLMEFRAALDEAPPDVLLHHARNRDFSRWLGDLSYDRVLREAVRRLEQTFADSRDHSSASDRYREQLASVIAERYPD